MGTVVNIRDATDSEESARFSQCVCVYDMASVHSGKTSINILHHKATVYCIYTLFKLFLMHKLKEVTVKLYQTWSIDYLGFAIVSIVDYK